MIKAVARGASYKEYMHQVPVIWNQGHRPLILADLVPGVFLHPQRELIKAVEGNSERGSAIDRVSLQVSGLGVPPPVSRRKHSDNQRTRNRHCDSSKTSVLWRRNGRGPEATFPRRRSRDGDNSHGEQ